VRSPFYGIVHLSIEQGTGPSTHPWELTLPHAAPLLPCLSQLQEVTCGYHWPLEDWMTSAEKHQQVLADQARAQEEARGPQ